TATSKAKRPQSHGVQDEGRLIDFYFFYCLLDGEQFRVVFTTGTAPYYFMPHTCNGRLLFRSW
ncbi:MAG TPA: hypothetical protein VGN02_06790, partial [Paenibacillus sp.]